MHMRGTPATMKSMTAYNNMIDEIKKFLADAVKHAVTAGVPKENIMLDPGIGFAKNSEQSIQILKEIDRFNDLGCPLLVGPSRKSFIGDILDEQNPEKRIWGTAGVIAYLAIKKVDFIRVHDVKEMQEVIKVINFII